METKSITINTQTLETVCLQSTFKAGTSAAATDVSAQAENPKVSTLPMLFKGRGQGCFKCGKTGHMERDCHLNSEQNDWGNSTWSAFHRSCRT